MTKAGAPSPIADIRYFSGGLTYVEGCHGATAFGRRVALRLQSQGISLGPWTHLYVRVSEGSPSDGRVRISEGVEWWHHFADLTVPIGFKAMSEAERNTILIAATRRALHTALPGSKAEVDAACDEVEARGESMRFSVKGKTVRGWWIEVSHNVEEWPAQSKLFVTVTDKATGRQLEALAAPLRIYTDSASLVGDVRCDEDTIIITPRNSFSAQVIAKSYKPPLVIPMSSLRAVEEPDVKTIVAARKSHRPSPY